MRPDIPMRPTIPACHVRPMRTMRTMRPTCPICHICPMRPKWPFPNFQIVKLATPYGRTFICIFTVFFFFFPLRFSSVCFRYPVVCETPPCQFPCQRATFSAHAAHAAHDAAGVTRMFCGQRKPARRMRESLFGLSRNGIAECAFDVGVRVR